MHGPVVLPLHGRSVLPGVEGVQDRGRDGEKSRVCPAVWRQREPEAGAGRQGDEGLKKGGGFLQFFFISISMREKERTFGQ